MSQYTKNNQNKQKGSEEGIDIRQLLGRFRKFWYLFVICPILLLGAAWFYLQYQVPVYEVKSNILIKDEKNKQGISGTDLIAKEFGLIENKKMLVDESKIMTSYTVIEKVVRDLALNRTVSYRGTLKNQEIYGAKCPIRIDHFILNDTLNDFKATLDVLDDQSFELKTADGVKQTYTFGNPFTNSYGSFLINPGNNPKNAKLSIICMGTEKAARGLIKTINIELPKKESNILEPTIRTTIPDKAKAILQKMVEVYNEHNLSDKKEVSQNTLAFIEKRLLSLTTELSGVERNVEAYKSREGITADGNSDIAYFFNKLGESDSELVKLEVQNTILTSIESLLTKTDPNFDLLPTNLELKSSSLQAQIADYNKQVLERNRLAKVAGDYNPSLKNLTLEINSIKKAIIENIGRVKQENATLLNRTKSKNIQFSNKLGKNPRNERELTDIKRQQNIKEGLYLFLLQKQEETAISLVSAVPDARIIDRPIVGDAPVGMKKSITYLAALCAGLLLSVIFVILQGLTVNTVQSEADITAKTPMPIIGKIPYAKTTQSWVVQAGSYTAISEKFRSLRSNVQYILPRKLQKPTGQVLLVTSATSGEGKSFITMNLAMSLAITEKRTIIVNLDLRKPSLSTHFPLSSKAIGITDYMTSGIYPDDIIQPSGIQEDLFFIHSGAIPSNPSELMMHTKMGLLFDYLKENFDYIVVNTSPIGLVSDALSLKPHVDMTLFVVRHGLTKKADLSIIQEFNEGQRLPLPVIVFNGLIGADKHHHSYYGHELGVIKDAPNTHVRISYNGWGKNKVS